MNMDFNQSLYREHLEEISALYDQRRTLGDAGQLPWYDFMDLEQRFEPHIDALIIGGEQALLICEEQAIEGDFGECYGAVRVMCRQESRSRLDDLLVKVNLADEDTSKAVGDALCQGLPLSFQDDIIHFLLKNGQDRIRLASRVIAFRRLDFAMELYDILLASSDDKAMAMEMLHALGRIRPRFGIERLLSFLHSKDKVIVDAAVTALVRIGERRVLRECMAFIGPGDWPKLSLGLYGDRHALTDSFFSVSGLDEDAQPQINRDYVIAAGLLGNIQAVRELIDYLDIPDLSKMAALSLFMITGADVEEEVFVPEEIDPDDLFDDERELWEKRLLFPKGQEPGQIVRRLSQNPEHWTAWWKKNRGKFNHELRYRNGTPYSPECLVNNLKSKTSPDILRKLAYEELVIRYGIDIPFETHMTVYQQLRAIETMMIRIDGNPDRFEPGLWYYNGKPITTEDDMDENLFFAGESV